MTLIDWHAMEILFVAAVALILIDYFFPVDFAAYIGYLCFAAGMFFALPLGPVLSLIIAVAIWALLLALHRFFFSRVLTNAPGVEANR